jgi:hypothetical protein
VGWMVVVSCECGSGDCWWWDGSGMMIYCNGALNICHFQNHLLESLRTGLHARF